MIKSKNNQQQSIIININTFKNIDSLILNLELSLSLQKSFIKEIDDKISSFLMNSKNKKEMPIMDELLLALPKVISRLGIPFVYLFINRENLSDKFFNFYWDNKYSKEIVEIFENILNVVNFSLYCTSLNEFKHYLLGSGIIQNKKYYSNKNYKMNSEQILFENISSMLENYKDLKAIGVEKEKVFEFKKMYDNILKEIKNLCNMKIAKIEFYQELIKPVGDLLKLAMKNQKNLINKNNEEKKVNNINVNKDYKNMNKEIESIVNISLDKRTFFYMKEKIKETPNQVIEFKNFPFPLSNENGEEIKRQLCSFLNSQGGRIYIGIDEQNIIKGIELNYKNRDSLRNSLINLTFDFYPKCRLDKIFVFFIPIKDLITKNFIKKKYIIKIRVYPGDPEFLYSMSNKGGYLSTIRKDGKCIDLDYSEIYKEIIYRDTLKNTKNNEQIETILKEKEIKDPEPEVNKDDLEDNEKNDIPAFGVDDKKLSKRKKIIKNMVRAGDITIKVTNIDEKIPVNEINKFFNGCKCSTQKFFYKKGYGYLNFSNENDAENCLATFNGCKIGNKKIKLSIVQNE